MSSITTTMSTWCPSTVGAVDESNGRGEVFNPQLLSNSDSGKHYVSSFLPNTTVFCQRHLNVNTFIRIPRLPVRSR